MLLKGAILVNFSLIRLSPTIHNCKCTSANVMIVLWPMFKCVSLMQNVSLVGVSGSAQLGPPHELQSFMSNLGHKAAQLDIQGDGRQFISPFYVLY